MPACLACLPVWRCWAACSGSHNAAIHSERGSRRCRVTPAVGALADVRSLRHCDGGFSVFVRPELALRLAQLADDGQLLLTTATGQLLVWILECLAAAPPAAAAVLPAAFKPAAGRPGDQRVLRSATADSGAG